jgi:hypothetical protein
MKRQTKGLLFVGLLVTIFAESHTLVGRLQLVGADFFNEGKHYAFCALQQDGKSLIALDNVARNHCHSDTEVELEATLTDAASVDKSSAFLANEPFQLVHGVVTKVLSANGIAISDPVAIGGSVDRNIKSQFEQMNDIAFSARRGRRLAVSSGRSDLLIVRVKLADDASVDSYCNEACAQANGWGTNSARTSYAQASYGQLDVSSSTGIVKTVTLTTTKSTYSGCNFDKLGNDAVAALDISINGFEVISFIMPFNIAGCGFGGVAYVGGSRSWVRYSDPGVMVHELGHSYGVLHAGTDLNNDGVQDTEYGDYSCVMGSPSSLVTMNAIHRSNLGWVPVSAVNTFICPARSNCDQTFAIADTQENPATAVSNGRYTMVKTPRAGRSGDYFISYRAGTDLDANIGSTWKNKVSLHYYAGDNTEFVTALSAGQSYVDTINVFGVSTQVMKITVQSIGGASAGAVVRVELFDSLPPSCEDVTVRMTDSYGDGWNGVNLYFTPDKSSSVTLPSGSLGTTSICLPPGTYSPFACDGSWQEEVGWTIVNYGLTGGASTTCGATSGSFTVTNNNSPTQLPTRVPTRGPTEAPSRAPTAAPSVSRAPTTAPSSAPTPSPTEAPICTTAVVTMVDSYGDGWNGNILHLGSHSITLASGSSGSSTVCLEPGEYVPTCCGGSWTEEVGWTVKIDGIVVSSGGASTSCSVTYTAFSVSGLTTDAPTIVPTNAPSRAPSMVPTQNPTFAPTSNPTAAPTVAATLTPTTESTVGGCNAADIQQILDNQALILASLRQLAGTSGAAEGQIPGGGANDDTGVGLTTGKESKNSNVGQPSGAVILMYVFAAVGGIATVAGTVALVLHKTGRINRQGRNEVPLTPLSRNQPNAKSVEGGNNAFAFPDSAFDASSA